MLDSSYPDYPIFSISSVELSESSPYAVVSASLSYPSSLDTFFFPYVSDSLLTQQSIDSISSTLQYFDPSVGVYGTWLPVDTSVGVLIPAGSTDVLLRFRWTNDYFYQDTRSFYVFSGSIFGPSVTINSSDQAFGLVSFIDNGTVSAVFLPDNTSITPTQSVLGPDDDRPRLAFTSVAVSESSPYAVVVAYLSRVSSQPVTFFPYLQDGSASSTNLDFLSGSLEYFDPSFGLSGLWRPVDSVQGVTIQSGQLDVLLRVSIVDDLVFESSEVFFLRSSAFSGSLHPSVTTATLSSSITILDNGSNSSYFSQDSFTDLPLLDPLGANDDRPSLQISSAFISESSPYAVLSATLTHPSLYPISFCPIAKPGSAEANSDFTPDSLEFFDVHSGDHGEWCSIDPGDSITFLPGQVELLIRIRISQDNLYEGFESFTVHASHIVGSLLPDSYSTGIYGSITVFDDSTNDNIFLEQTNSSKPVVDPNGPDDDRPVLSISSIAVSEASEYAVVVAYLSNPSTKPITFFPSLVDGTATSTAPDYFSSPLQFLIPGSLHFADWTAVDPAIGVTFEPGFTQVFLRAQLINDFIPETSETFYVSSGDLVGDLSPAQHRPVDGSVTIYDDGSVGNVFLESNDSSIPTLGLADDDNLVVAVDSLIVSEGSPWAVYHLSGKPGQLISLSLLADGSALAGLDFGTALSLSTDSGKTWTPYVGGFVALTPGGTLLVRNPIYNDTPPVDEPDEDFYLQVTDHIGQQYLASVFIVDNGNSTALVFNGNGSLDESTPKDDDTDSDLDGLVDTGESSDLNQDSILDSEQGNVASLAWINSQYFIAQNRTVPSAPLNSLVAVVAGSSLDHPDPRLQFSAVSVDPFTAAGKSDPFTGLIYSSVSSIRPISGSLIDRSSAWEPLSFTLTQSSVADVDPLTGGVQIDVFIDISRFGAANSDFNSFLVYNSNSRYGRQGWYQLNRNSVRTQSEFLDLNTDGFLDAVRLRFTDNALGDMSSVAGQISVLGMPVQINPSLPTPIGVSGASGPSAPPGLLASRLLSASSFL